VNRILLNLFLAIVIAAACAVIMYAFTHPTF
jgi:hypothetical protein